MMPAILPAKAKPCIFSTTNSKEKIKDSPVQTWKGSAMNNPLNNFTNKILQGTSKNIKPIGLLYQEMIYHLRSCQFFVGSGIDVGIILQILSVKSIATQLFIQNPLEHQGRFLGQSPKSPFFFRWGHRGRLFFLSKKKKSLPLTG